MKRVEVNRSAAEYLSTINFSAGPQAQATRSDILRVQPAGRRGLSTRNTLCHAKQFRRTTREFAHAEGIVLYLSFGEHKMRQARSQERKSHRASDFSYTNPAFRLEGLGLRADKDGNLCPAICIKPRSSNSIKAESFEFPLLPPEQNIDAAQDADGEPGKFACRRQGLGTEQRLCWCAPSKYCHRADRNVGTVSRTPLRVNRNISTTSSLIEK